MLAGEQLVKGRRPWQAPVVFGTPGARGASLRKGLEHTEAEMEFRRANPPLCRDGEGAGTRREDQSKILIKQRSDVEG